MYENVGGKIKVVATAITGLGITASIVLFLILLARLTIESAILGIVIFIVGSLLSWLSALTLYGLGQLIENSDIIAGRITIEKITEKKSDSKNTASSNTVVARNTTPKKAQSFEELVDNARLPQETISEVKKLKEMMDLGEITESECRKKVRKLISDLAIDDIFIIMKKL